jgi:hypothetical protein
MRASVCRRALGLTVMMSAAAVGTGCGPFARSASTPRVTYPLIVHNRSDFEVVVYAVPSVGGAGIRLGNARAFATTNMQVPSNALQSSETLVLTLHTIGAGKSCAGISAQCLRSPMFTTGGATLDSSLVAELDIRADHNGGLGHSMLYTQLASIAHQP